MTQIDVTRLAEGDPLDFEVRVRDRTGESGHRVTMARDDFQRLSDGHCTAEQCIEAAFRFLLDREPRSAILARFDVTVISRYFPEFERALPDYLDQPEASG